MKRKVASLPRVFLTYRRVYMTKQEFKEFCHEEFTKRGFKKRRNMWYLQGKGLLCGMYLQKSMAEAFYVEYL